MAARRRREPVLTGAGRHKVGRVGVVGVVAAVVVMVVVVDGKSGAAGGGGDGGVVVEQRVNALLGEAVLGVR